MQNNEYVVEMRGIDKIYPNGIAANQGVDFLVKKGEIHALMGENGAGTVFFFQGAGRSY